MTYLKAIKRCSPPGSPCFETTARPSGVRRWDTIQGSNLANLKELRASAGRARLRVLFAFDSQRQAVLLTGGNKAGQWQSWYRGAIPAAERLYAEHAKRLGEENP